MTTPKQLDDAPNLDISLYLTMIENMKKESFNIDTNTKLSSHPYLLAAKEGKLTLAQRQAFVGEQYVIQYSDACSFAALAGIENFRPTSLSSASLPPPPSNSDKDKSDLFYFLLGGEIYASQLLLDHAKSVGFEIEQELHSYTITARAQAYPSYWARLALARNRGAAAAACAVNFPAWGKMCKELSEVLHSHPEYGYCEDKAEAKASLAFIDFFSSPIENLNQMAATIMMEESTSYGDVVTAVRLLQQYEVLFWDAVYDAK